MSAVVHHYIEKYLRDLLPDEAEALVKLRQKAEADLIPIIHPEVRNLLEMIIKNHRITTILEVGTAVGYSASVFVHAMGDHARRLDTIERNPAMVVKAKKNIAAMGYGDKIHLLEGDATEIVPKLEDNSYELVFLDGAKGHYVHLLPDCLRILKPGGFLICDNVLYKGMIANKDLVIRRRTTIVKRMQRFLEEISCHPDLLTTIIPMGDGVSISVLQEPKVGVSVKRTSCDDGMKQHRQK